MALLEIPTRTDGTPHYEQRSKLDGVDYTLTFRFGERRGGWVFDMYTVSGDEIIVGQLVIIGRDLLRRSTSPNKPPGALFALNLQSDDAGRLRELPGLYDLGDRCRLYYREA
jgi:hypothetical protein